VVVGLPEDNLFYTYLDLPAAAQLEQKEQYRQWTLEVQDELFATSEALVPQGSRSWPGQRQRSRVRRRRGSGDRTLAAFARDHQVYFFPSLLVLGDYDGPDRNKVLAIRPNGQIAYVHYKGRNRTRGSTRATGSR